MDKNNNIIAFPNSARLTQAERFLMGAKIRDARKAMRINQVELSHAVGVTRQAISAFELDEISPDPVTFSRIAEALKQPISYFTSPANPSFGQSETRFYRKFGTDTVRRNDACAVLGEWFVQVAKYLSNYVNFPTTSVPQFTPANEQKEYSFDEINEIADQVRKKWGLGAGPISNVLSLMESKGIVICRYEMTGENIEAFSYWNAERPFVFIASEKEVGARSRFDLAHELGHLVLHRNVTQEELEDKSRLKIVEKEANWFAGAFLLPQSTFPNEIFSPRLDAFLPLKARWKVSIQAMIYRCHSLGIFDDDQTLNLRKQISFRRWRTKEPMDDPRTIPLEQPKLLQKAVHLLIEHQVKHSEDFKDDLRLRPELLEDFCGLSRGTLSKNNIENLRTIFALNRSRSSAT